MDQAVTITEPTRFKHYSQIPPGAWRWRNFRLAEIACRHCGEIIVDPVALDRLQQLRDQLGVPIMVNSAYRCPVHNRAVSGVPGGQHLLGKAFDISMANHDPHDFEAAARAVGFRGFGFYPKAAGNFMHIDMGPSRTWGTPWPPKTEAFPVEPPRAREDLKDSRTIKGAKGAGAAIAGAVALDSDKVRSIVDQATGWSSALPDGSTLKYLLLGAAVVGLGLVVYARWDDWTKGKR